jgi:acetyl esterase/lipase
MSTDSSPWCPFAAEVPYASGSSDVDRPLLFRYSVPAEVTALPLALLIFPGGGYNHLAQHEGAGYAEWFTARGITCFVLHYRLGSNGYRYPAILADARRAMRHLRHRQAEWNLPTKTQWGVMGSSAGGHLAASLSTLWDHGNPQDSDPVEQITCRPDFTVLCYPVITFVDQPVVHKGSRAAFLGAQESEDPAICRRFSPHLNVTDTTPPAFLWHTAEDSAVPARNSLLYSSALLDVGVSCELHLYPDGRHGLGLNCRHPWQESCLRWLQDRLNESK